MVIVIVEYECECVNVLHSPMELDMCYGRQVACSVSSKLGIWAQLIAGAGNIHEGTWTIT